MDTVHVPPSMIFVFISTLFLTSRVYPSFLAVIGNALQVTLVEFCVYSSVAVISLKTDFNTKTATKWTKIGGGYTVRMF